MAIKVCLKMAIKVCCQSNFPRKRDGVIFGKLWNDVLTRIWWKKQSPFSGSVLYLVYSLHFVPSLCLVCILHPSVVRILHVVLIVPVPAFEFGWQNFDCLVVQDKVKPIHNERATQSFFSLSRGRSLRLNKQTLEVNTKTAVRIPTATKNTPNYFPPTWTRQ